MLNRDEQVVENPINELKEPNSADFIDRGFYFDGLIYEGKTLPDLIQKAFQLQFEKLDNFTKIYDSTGVSSTMQQYWSPRCYSFIEDIVNIYNHLIILNCAIDELEPNTFLHTAATLFFEELCQIIADKLLQNKFFSFNTSWSEDQSVYFNADIPDEDPDNIRKPLLALLPNIIHHIKHPGKSNKDIVDYSDSREEFNSAYSQLKQALKEASEYYQTNSAPKPRNAEIIVSKLIIDENCNDQVELTSLPPNVKLHHLKNNRKLCDDKKIQQLHEQIQLSEHKSMDNVTIYPKSIFASQYTFLQINGFAHAVFTEKMYMPFKGRRSVGCAQNLNTGKWITFKSSQLRAKLSTLSLENEAKILKHLGKPVNFFLDKYNAFKRPRECLVTDFIPGRDASSYQYKRKIPEHRIFEFLLQALTNLHLIHQQDVLHCDIKPPNFIYCEEKNDLQWIDFNNSLLANNGIEEEYLRGTPDYIPPEVTKKKWRALYLQRKNRNIFTWMQFMGVKYFKLH